MGQSTVTNFIGSGVPGSLFDNSPFRDNVYTLDSADPADNNIGSTVFTFKAGEDGIVEAGNPTGVAFYGGFLVNVRNHASYGTPAGGTLAPTLNLLNGTPADILSMGLIWVTLPNIAVVGDQIVYDNVTGAITAIPRGDPLPVGASDAYAEVYYYNVTIAPGLAVVRVTYSPAAVV